MRNSLLTFRLDDFWRRIKKWITSFPTSLIIGILLGIAFTLILQNLSGFFAGVILGVILEQIFLGNKRAFEEWRNTDPMRVLLGSIATNDDCYIFFSSYFRDLSRPTEFKLSRWGARQAQREVLITGPDFVLGEGDALALSLIQSLLARVPKRPEKIKVERGDEELDKWGVSAFCIGAHNGKTRVILEKFRNPFFKFDNNYTVITRPNAPVEHYEPTGELMSEGVYIIPCGDAEPTDYGMILKFKDQFRDNGKTVFIVAGIGPAGTSGAAYYLLTNYKELAKEGDEFGVLIQVPSGFQSARRVEFEKVCSYYIIKR